MIELTVKESTLKIAIACADCGHDLSVKVCRRGQEQWVEVWPCKTCLNSAYELATPSGIGCREERRRTILPPVPDSDRRTRRGVPRSERTSDARRNSVLAELNHD